MKSQTMISSTHFILHVSLFLYSFFYWITQPIFPYLSSSLGASSTTLAYLSALSQLIQLMGAPAMGKLMDKTSSRLVLILSHLGASLSYALLACAVDANTVLLSQLPTFFLASMHASQVYLTLSIRDTSSRASALGALSLSYACGMALGPFVGGQLSARVSYAAVSMMCAIGSTATALMVHVLLPEPSFVKGNNERNDESDKKKDTDGLVRTIATLLSSPELTRLMFVKLFAGLALSIYRFAFVLIAKDEFKLSASDNGTVMTVVACLGVLANSGLVPILTRYFSHPFLIRMCLLLLALSFLLVPFALSIEALLASALPITLAGSVGSLLLTALFTESTKSSDAGSVLGLDQSMGTIARVAAPLLVGVFLAQEQPRLFVGLAAAAAAGFALLLSPLEPKSAISKSPKSVLEMETLLKKVSPD